MTKPNLSRRVVAAAFAIALAAGGLASAGSVGDNADASQEHTGATWSFTGHPHHGGGASTNGATWS